MRLDLFHSRDSNLSGWPSQGAVADPLCSYPKLNLRDNWLTSPTQMTPCESLNIFREVEVVAEWEQRRGIGQFASTGLQVNMEMKEKRGREGRERKGKEER